MSGKTTGIALRKTRRANVDAGGRGAKRVCAGDWGTTVAFDLSFAAGNFIVDSPSPTSSTALVFSHKFFVLERVQMERDCFCVWLAAASGLVSNSNPESVV